MTLVTTAIRKCQLVNDDKYHKSVEIAVTNNSLYLLFYGQIKGEESAGILAFLPSNPTVNYS